MYDKDAVEFHDQAAHLKEPLYTKPITNGYVKDL